MNLIHIANQISENDGTWDNEVSEIVIEKFVDELKSLRNFDIIYGCIQELGHLHPDILE